MAEEKLVSQTELAKILNVSQPAIHKYIKQGKIPADCLVREGRYTKIKCNQAIEALRRSLDPARSRSVDNNTEREKIGEAGIDEDTSFAEAQRLDRLYTAALKKLEYEEKKGKLVDVEEVKSTMIKLVIAAKTKLLGIRSKVAPLVQDYLPDIDERESVLGLIDSVIREALEELSRGDDNTLATQKGN